MAFGVFLLFYGLSYIFSYDLNDNSTDNVELNKNLSTDIQKSEYENVLETSDVSQNSTVDNIKPLSTKNNYSFITRNS